MQEAIKSSHGQGSTSRPKLIAALQAQLDAKERVHWTGYPNPATHAYDARGAYYFGGIWCAFLLFWSAAAFSGSAFFALFSVPFWLIGGYILLAPTRARRKAERTVYAITDKRAMIVTVNQDVSVRSFNFRTLPGIERREKGDGSGDLIFTHDIETDSEGTSRRAAGFIGIPNVREAESVIHSQQHASDRAPA